MKPLATVTPHSRWVSLNQYAVLWGISRSTVRKWKAQGMLETYRTTKQLLRIRNQPPKGAA
jgi:predicted site-specific integrase-resolvase